MSNLSWAWTLKILGINMLLTFIWYQGWEIPLYIKKKQANRFKYNHIFPQDVKKKFFWFKSQTIDNMARSMLFGVPIWSFLQIIMGKTSSLVVDGRRIYTMNTRFNEKENKTSIKTIFFIN